MPALLATTPSFNRRPTALREEADLLCADALGNSSGGEQLPELSALWAESQGQGQLACDQVLAAVHGAHTDSDRVVVLHATFSGAPHAGAMRCSDEVRVKATTPADSA